MKPRLYHNNNCSKSRMCKKILEDNNIDFEIGIFKRSNDKERN